jgi:hypothetical protein
MVFGQEKLIEDEHLEDFLNCLGYGWDCGWSAKKIAKEMDFESLGLKPYHVYYFAEKYRVSHGFTPRQKIKKKSKPPANAVPYTQDMPPNVAEYLRSQGLLVE